MTMRPQVEGDQRKSSAPGGKEPAQAFSNVTNTMSEVSRNDRPMSDHETETSPLQPTETSLLPGSAKSAAATSASPGTVKSTSCAQPKSKKEESSDQEESEEETERTESESEKEDEEELEQALITKLTTKPKPKPVVTLTPDVICLDEKDKFEHSDPTTGAITFWRNTAPLSAAARQLSWTGRIVDEGTPPTWPPPEPMSTLGPMAADQQGYDVMVAGMAETAVNWEPIRDVFRHDPQWPNIAFARINDLDRSLADMANRLVFQAFTSSTVQEQTAETEFEERKLKETNDFLDGVGKMGTGIGQEFEAVAEQFAELAYLLDALRKIAEDDDCNSPAIQNDLQNMKAELQRHCETLKTRLIELKAQITDYGNGVSKYVKDTKNQDKFSSKPQAANPDEIDASKHRAAFERIKQLNEDIESDAKNDKAGVFKRWYDQSRLRHLLNLMHEYSSQSVQESEKIDRVNKLKPPRLPKKPSSTVTQLKTNQSGLKTEPFRVGEKTSDSDDDKFDFYSQPERTPGFRIGNMEEKKSPTSDTADNKIGFYSQPERKPGFRMGDVKEKKAEKKPGSASKGEKFDFYTAPEPKYEI